MTTLKISDGKTTHTVSTKEEALHLIERYFEKKGGQKHERDFSETDQ